LHSLASTLSLAFRWHGPSVGVSGGPGHVEESLLVGMALMRSSGLPGLWVVISDADLSCEVGNVQAVALALRPTEFAQSGWCLSLEYRPTDEQQSSMTLLDLVRFLQSKRPELPRRCPLASGHLVLSKES
jgi:hypothetical protein